MPQDIVIRPLILFIIILLCIYQNTEEKEKEVLIACKDGDLEAVKRLSSVITVGEVSDYVSGDSPLHIAVRYVDLLFRTKIYTVLMQKILVLCDLHITMSFCISEDTL